MGLERMPEGEDTRPSTGVCHIDAVCKAVFSANPTVPELPTAPESVGLRLRLPPLGGVVL